MTPVPYRGRRNESMYLSYVARKIAEIKGMDYEELVELTNINAKRFLCIVHSVTGIFYEMLCTVHKVFTKKLTLCIRYNRI